MRVTLREVADRAGVSRSAVSRSFTEGASVSASTREKVLKAAAELGYSPNVLASSLTTRRTKLIGLVADNLRNPVFLEVIDLFTRLIQDGGFRPLLVNLAGETDPQHSVRLLRQYSVDGVIVASSTLPSSFAAAFRDAGLPVVHTFGRGSGGSHAPVVGVDNIHCGQLAAQALLGRGYRRVAFFGGPESASSTQDRLRGFAAELRAQGLEPAISYCTGYSYRAGRAAMECLIAAGNLPEAFFCGDDVISLGAIDALRAAGLDVPGDIGIIGFNDIDMAAWDCIGLTTIRQPVDRIISASVDLILSLVQDAQAGPESLLLPCEVIHRGTLRRI